MSDSKPLNPGLFRVHRLFMVLYAVLCTLLILIGLKGAATGDWGSFGGLFVFGVFLGAIGLAHWHAMKGASLGKTYGRRISRIFGCLWLIGFPIGTILGVYVLVKASDGNWVAETPEAPA